MAPNARYNKFTKQAVHVLRFAQEIALQFHHNYVGVEHLLLSLLYEEGCVAAKVLHSLGVELKGLRSTIEDVIYKEICVIADEISLTSRAKQVIELAVDEAYRLGHFYMGTEHILLGLIRLGNNIASGTLNTLGVDLEKARRQTKKVLSQ